MYEYPRTDSMPSGTVMVSTDHVWNGAGVSQTVPGVPA
jgi:hypothetical protein